MSYLILQIIVCLAAAALLGVAFGWLMARRDIDERLEEERNVRSSVVADWQSRHQEAVDLGDAARTRIASLETELDILRGELQAKAERAIQLETRIERGAAELRRVTDGNSGRAAELEQLQSEVTAAQERLAGARAALSDKDNIIAQLQRGLADRDKLIPALQADLSGRDAETREARRLAAELEGKARGVQAELESGKVRIAALEELLAARAARVAELEANLALRREALSPLPASSPLQDDLKLIRGIGPKLERMLNQLGVVHYRQIAAWSDEEIDAMQAKLEGFPERIRRDHWVEGAKTEHKRKYGEDL